MCNLYSLTKGQAAIRDLFRAKYDRTGNLPLFPSVFPDQMAPIVRTAPDGERELVTTRWGMPGPLQFGGQPVTNIRNLNRPHWREWLDGDRRFFVPATSLCEYVGTKPRKTPTWFTLSEDRPLRKPTGGSPRLPSRQWPEQASPRSDPRSASIGARRLGAGVGLYPNDVATR
jgi:putative SOS response-associated peptidase YedK